MAVKSDCGVRFGTADCTVIVRYKQHKLAIVDILTIAESITYVFSIARRTPVGKTSFQAFTFGAEKGNCAKLC